MGDTYPFELKSTQMPAMTGVGFGSRVGVDLEMFPTAALIIDTVEDLVIHSNNHARKLIAGDATDGSRFSRHIDTHLSNFIVFIDEIAHRGEAWTRKVPMLDINKNVVNCEMRGHQFGPGSSQVLLVIFDLDEFSHHERITETEKLQREGLIGWKRAQEFFSELELRNQLILNAAGEGIYGVNTQGQTTFVNRAAQEMLGWTAEEMLGKSIHGMIHHHHTDGSTYHAHDCPIYRSFRFEQINRVEDEYFWRKDGKPIQVEYVSTPIYHQKVLAGAVVIFRDVTERKTNEKKLLAAMEEVAELRDRLEQENAYLQEEITRERAHHDVIGRSGVIRQLHAKIDLVAPTNAPVLITGETGTGKAIVANAIHKNGARKGRPLIHFKCGSMSRAAMEVELFGKLETSASDARPQMTSGAMELAHGGTLYVENICELPLELQRKMLQALQQRKFKRIGDPQYKNVDLRIIAASTKNIEKEVAAGRFDEELFLALNVFPIECTALRERREDIPDLVGHLLSIECERLNREIPIVTERTMRMLMDYAWPGNVRELRNVIERAVIVSRDGKLIVELGTRPQTRSADVKTVRTENEMKMEIRANLVSALRETRGKVSGASGAAALLGIEPTTLYSRIRKFGIEKSEWRLSE